MTTPLVVPLLGVLVDCGAVRRGVDREVVCQWSVHGAARIRDGLSNASGIRRADLRS